MPRPKTTCCGDARVDGVVAALGDVPRGHAVEELIVGDLARLEQVEVVRPGGQVVHVLELVEEEAQEVELDRVDDLLAVAAERLGHHSAEVEDRSFQGALEGSVSHPPIVRDTRHAVGVSRPRASWGSARAADPLQARQRCRREP